MTITAVYSKTPGLDRFLNSIQPLKKELVELDVYPGNKERWRYLPKALSGQVIFTDTDDVIYQGGLPELSGIITAPENVLHRDSFWRNQCIGEYEVLLDKPVYNAGMMSMDAVDLYSLADFILGSNGNDQLAYNLWLYDEKHTPRIDVFLPLYNNFERCEKKDGWYYQGKKPCFVHSNGIKGRL